MMIFGPLVWATTSPETVTFASASSVAVTEGPSTRSTAGSVIAAPGSLSSFSISMTSPSATLYCLPPVLTIAYIVDAPSCLLWSRCCPVSVDFFSCLWCGTSSCASPPGRHDARRRAHPWVTPRCFGGSVSVASPTITPRTSRRQSIRTHQTQGVLDQRTRAPQSPLRSSVPNAYSTRPRHAGQTSARPDKRSSGLTQPGSDARNSGQLDCCSAGMDTISGSAAATPAAGPAGLDAARRRRGGEAEATGSAVAAKSPGSWSASPLAAAAGSSPFPLAA